MNRTTPNSGNKMAENGVHSSFVKLNDQNYGIWKFKMRLLLTREKLLQVVTQPKPENANAEWISKDEKAQALIGLALEDSQLIHVIQLTSSKAMWDALQGYHERASLSSKIHVMRQMFAARMPEGGNMGDHLQHLSSLRLRLMALGEELKDPSFVALMLSSLPKSYDGLIVALESRPDADLTVDFVKGKLLDEGRRRAQEGEKEEQALFSSAVSNNKRKEKVCYYCKKEGHYKRDCKKRAANQEKESTRTTRMAVLHADDMDVCLFTGKTKDAGVWYLDSGATSHMTNDVSVLENVNRSKESSILLADGKHTNAVGIGTGRMISVDGNGIQKNVSLANVYHVPSLAGNLLSVSKITDMGFEVLFDRTGCKVLQNGKAVLVGVREGGLYYMKQSFGTDAVN